MILTREDIQRMTNSTGIGGIGRGGEGGGGGSGVDLAGYATESWVNENYLSIEFFSKLFKAHSANGDVVPNDTDTTITDIQAMFGFWTNSYLSALGQNSGGGGGAMSLSGLVDVAITSPQTGQVLTYDGTSGKWVNGAGGGGGGGTVTSVGVSMPTGFVVNGSPVSSSGTIQVTFVSGYSLLTATQTSNWNDAYDKRHTHLNGSVIDGITAYNVTSWNTAATWVTNNGSDVASMTWVGNNYLGINATAADATKLHTARTLWGQSFDGTANVSGSMTGVGTIQMGTYLAMNTANSQPGLLVEGYWESSTGVQYVTFGYHSPTNNTSWQTVDSQDVKILQLMVDANNTVAKKYALVKDALRIGDGLLLWDSTNGAFKVIKADGTAAHLYATGGVSALGMSAGVSAVDAMTFGYLTVNNNLYIKNGSNSNILYTNNSGKLVVEASHGMLADCNLTVNDATLALDGDSTLQLNGCALYLNSTSYLHMDGNTLKININGTDYRIVTMS